MSFRQFYIILATLAVATSAASWAADDRDEGHKFGEDNKDQELEKVRQVCVRANPEQLQKLTVDANDETAIRAAWEKARRQLAEDIVADGHNKEGTLLKGADQFVGFLEGRLRVPVPRWWGSELAQARARELEKLEFFNGIDTLGDVVRQIQNAPRGISTAFGVVPTVEQNDTGDVKVVWDNRKIQVSAKQIPNDPKTPDWAGLVYRDRCFIVRYDRQDLPWLNVELCCVDPGSSIVVWSTKRIFDVRRESGGGCSGSSIHHVALVCRDDVVVLFGMEFSMIYIEAFRLSDGRPLMRFNSTY
jgi:hypothetical protein